MTRMEKLFLGHLPSKCPSCGNEMVIKELFYWCD